MRRLLLSLIVSGFIIGTPAWARGGPLHFIFIAITPSFPRRSSDAASIRPADFGGPGIGPNENTCSQDKPENYLSDLDADVDEHVKAFDRQRDGTTQGKPRRQNSDAATLMRDHQQRMAAIYAERDRELQNEWRRENEGANHDRADNIGAADKHGAH